MALGRDGAAAGPRALAVRDVLPEGGRAGDGRLVDLLVLPDVVRGAVANHGADLGALGRARAVVGVLLDVVLDQGVRRPPIDGHEDGSSGGAGGAAEGDVPALQFVSTYRTSLSSPRSSGPGAKHSFCEICLPGGAGAPALADHEVAGPGERDGVSVARGGKVDGAAGHVVLVVVLAAGEAVAAKLEVRAVRPSCRGGKCPSERRDGNEEFGEAEHFGCMRFES